MSRVSIQRRLAAITPDLRAAVDEVRVLDEQIRHFADSAEDARLRSLVSETPLASKEHREAAKTLAGLQRDRTKWAERVLELEAQQDALLDALNAAS